MTTFTELHALSPQEYARFQDAAKARAHALRGEAMSGFWDALGHAVQRAWQRAGAALAQPRQAKRTGPSLA